MESAFGIDTEMSDEIAKLVMAKANTIQVVAAIKDAINKYADEVTDSLTNYLGSEYSLRFDEIVYRRANQLVESLLKGEKETGRKFSLTSSVWLGKEVQYDNEGVRKAIVEQFKDEIQNAEMIRLQKEIEELKESVYALARQDRYSR